MDNTRIQPVSPGQKVQAQTINQLIDSVDFGVRTTGARTHIGKDVNIQVNDQGQRVFSGQKFREPFDLSVGIHDQKLAIDVVRSHMPNENGGFTDVPAGDPVTFPQQEDVKIYLCELSSGGRKVMSSVDDGLSAAKTKTALWTIKTNGVVLEDSRTAALGGGDGGQTELDLSSLNWVQVSSEGEGGETVWSDSPSAQMWDYGRLQDGDIADKAELTASNGWMFPVRPPDGLPHLQYVELSTMQDVVGGGGGGGGGCSCGLSVTPPAVLSSLGQNLVQIADWTKDSWRTHVPILAPDTAGDVRQLFQWMEMTPFWYHTPTHRIRNNYFYNGRTWNALADFTVTRAGTYYLKIEDNLYGVAPSYTIVHSTTAPNAMSNTDTVTYYPIWTITSELKAEFDWRLTWMLPRYSN